MSDSRDRALHRSTDPRFRGALAEPVRDKPIGQQYTVGSSQKRKSVINFRSSFISVGKECEILALSHISVPALTS